MKKKAGFTIEAAIVIPLLLFVVIIVMYLGFFLYNREALTVIASRAVLKGVQMEQDGKKTIEREVSLFVKDQMEKNLIFTESFDWEVKVTGLKVKVTLQLTQAMPFKNVTCEVTKEMSRIHPVSFLWEKERFQSKE